jgi:hypothetical protein
MAHKLPVTIIAGKLNVATWHGGDLQMISLKSVAISASLVGVFLLGLGLRDGMEAGRTGLVQQARAAGIGPGNRTCNARTLMGAYGIKFDGFSIKTGQPVQLDSVSLITFDGFQVFTVSEKGRLNGEAINRTFTGPYVVRSDCTGYLDYTTHLTDPSHPVHGEFVIVDEGKEFFVLDDEDGWQATGIGKRL